MPELKVTCEWDDEVSLWYVADSNVPGLSGEAPDMASMNALLSERIPELLRLNMPHLVTEAPTEEPLHIPYELYTRQRQDLILTH
jgi:hypothetical protein